MLPCVIAACPILLGLGNAPAQEALISDLLEAAASDVSALTGHMFWRLNADGSCPKFVSIFRTVVPERLAEHLESMADERVTDRRLQAAVTSQLRIPSLTPSHEVSPCVFIRLQVRVISLTNSG
jgi:hypothetical protein